MHNLILNDYIYRHVMYKLELVLSYHSVLQCVFHLNVNVILFLLHVITKTWWLLLFCCAIYFQMPADTTLISDWLDYSYLTFFRTLIKANTSFVLFHGMITNIQNTSIEMLTLWHEQHCTLWLLRSSKCKLCKMTIIIWSAKEYKSNTWILL